MVVAYTAAGYSHLHYFDLGVWDKLRHIIATPDTSLERV